MRDQALIKNGRHRTHYTAHLTLLIHLLAYLEELKASKSDIKSRIGLSHMGFQRLMTSSN